MPSKRIKTGIIQNYILLTLSLLAFWILTIRGLRSKYPAVQSRIPHPPPLSAVLSIPAYPYIYNRLFFFFMPSDYVDTRVLFHLPSFR